MSYFEAPDGSRQEIFGSGGGEEISRALSLELGYPVPLLAQIPIDVALREGSDSGHPVAAEGGTPGAEALLGIASTLATRARGLAGRPLGVTPKS